ncbi:MAG: PDZ domain-containing protein, partial [Anaerolineae bacterium]|nr:PDZ domain-containing protein [Anaerolineae bacterium]
MRRYQMLGLVLLVLALLSTGVVAALAQDTPTTFPYLGVDVVPNMNGAQVVFVEPDSPASQADVRYLDVIAKIDNDAVTAATLGNLLHNHQIGDAVTLDIQRGEENVTLQATLSARPDYFPPMLREEAIRYNAQDKAWRINVLSENEPLYESGLRPGDSILKFGDYAMTPRALSLFLEGKAPSDHIAVTIQREDQEMTLEVPVSALRTLEVFSINFFEIPFEILFVPE